MRLLRLHRVRVSLHFKRCLSSAHPTQPHQQSKWQAYVQLGRYDKPVGTWLLLWPCTWSITLASIQTAQVLPDPSLLARFALGALVMRGAGCTINDILDKDFDSKVERTKSRPLASKKLTTKEAIVFLGGQLSIGLAVLMSLNEYSIILGASSMLLVCTYPLMKRITWYPQVFLGLTFNWGALLGWSAVAGEINSLAPLSLYVSSICWTLVYDTIYAHQDKEDDKKIGVKSTALKFGDQTIPILKIFATANIAGLALTGYLAGLEYPMSYNLFSVAAPAVHMFWQLNTVDLDNQMDCDRKFKSNINLGASVFLGILGSGIVSYYHSSIN